MKEKELFLKALSTLFWSWGSEAPAEAVWAGNELLEWYEAEYNITIIERFTEDCETIGEQYEKVIESIKKLKS